MEFFTQKLLIIENIKGLYLTSLLYTNNGVKIFTFKDKKILLF